MLHAAARAGVWILIGFVLLGAVPMLIGAYEFALIGLHRWRNHFDRVEPFLPRVAVLIPAWNEVSVIGASIDRMMAMDYPASRLRVYVVDDASTDDTQFVVAAAASWYPGRVIHLRRAHGGAGKAHTLNHGLRVLLDDDWMEALLITDADVQFEPDALRKMTRHLTDPGVGAVTAFIKEGSRPGNSMTRFIGYEYVTAQAAARRSQNVLGAQACLAGGAQLHTRANLEAIGGRIDTTTLAEDTVTTFLTQLAGRRVIFDGDAVAWAEEPGSIRGLWAQRVRWARGNVQVTRRFRHVWFRPRWFGPRPAHRLGGVSFGVIWFSLFLQPLLMLLASASLVALYLIDAPASWRVFHPLWICNVVTFAFITAFALSLDPSTARRTWKQAITFPGLVSLAILVYAAFPGAVRWGADGLMRLTGVHPGPVAAHALVLFVYAWLGASMFVSYLAKRLEGRRGGRFWSPLFLYVGGYGPLLCSVTLAAYWRELRRAEMRWEKTEKEGKMAVAA